MALRWLAVGLALAAPISSYAGPYGDDMAKCLVRSTTSEDKTALVRWMFAMMSLHPAVKTMATVSDEQRTAASKHIADIFQELLTKSCVNETKDAVKYEGEVTIASSFSVLGQVAARELFQDPNVAAGLADLGKAFDTGSLRKTLGLTPQ